MAFVLIVLALIGAAAVLVFFVLPDNQPPAKPPTDAEVTTVRKIEQEDTVPIFQEASQHTDEVSRMPIESPKISSYIDGTYTAIASYFTPKRVKHEISATLTVRNDIITSADVQYDGESAKTPSHQGFDGAYRPLLLGVSVDNLDLSRVGGASLTTTAFNEALADIKSDASLHDTN